MSPSYGAHAGASGRELLEGIFLFDGLRQVTDERREDRGVRHILEVDGAPRNERLPTEERDTPRL
jgi:hypothetical protein